MAGRSRKPGFGGIHGGERGLSPPGEYSVEFSFDLTSWEELTDVEIAVGESSAITVDGFANPTGNTTGVTKIFYRILSLAELE